MNKNELMMAYFGKIEVTIEGGFSSPAIGYMVEIIGIEGNVPRRSISIWELSYRNFEMAKNVFKSCFGITPEQAVEIDRKKGVLKTPINFLKHREEVLA